MIPTHRATPQSGFTLIELIAVIAILGVLAVVAVPRFINMQDSAEASATSGMAGQLASAFSLNFAACAANDANCVAVDNCNDGGLLLQGPNAAGTSNLPAGYSINSVDIDAGSTANCTVTGPGGNTADFVGMRN